MEQMDRVVAGLVGRQIVRVVYHGLSVEQDDEPGREQRHGEQAGPGQGEPTRPRDVEQTGRDHGEQAKQAGPGHREQTGPRDGDQAGRDHGEQAKQAGPGHREQMGPGERRGDGGDLGAPAALHLEFAGGGAWVVAALEQDDGSWWLGADDLAVAFTEDWAARMGLRT